MELSEKAKTARRDAQRKWRENNRERFRELQRNWRANNRDRVREHQRRYWGKVAENMEE